MVAVVVVLVEHGCQTKGCLRVLEGISMHWTGAVPFSGNGVISIEHELVSG